MLRALEDLDAFRFFSNRGEMGISLSDHRQNGNVALGGIGNLAR